MRILHYKRLESTNTTAYELAEADSPDWTVVVADAQTKGRGRSGRRWESPKGGLWFSIIVRPQISSNRVHLLQFVAANAIRQALEAKTRVQAQLKWPNDLVIDTKKLGGILIESRTVGQRVLFAIIGIGLNLSQPNSQLPKGAVSLRLATGRKYSPENLLKAIVDETKSRLDSIDNSATIMTEWWQHCIHRPPIVEVSSPLGVFRGISRSIDDYGALTVETSDGRTQRVTDGTLRMLSEPTI